MAKKNEDPFLPTQDQPKHRGKIVGDPELVAMNQMNRILGKLSEKAQLRVIAWLTAKTEFPIIDGIKE